MQNRPQLSLSIGRRPSLQVPTTASAGPSSPLAQSPYTPQTTSFFPTQESYFPSFAPGPSTPPISANGLYPPPFPGRRGLLRRNSSLSSVSSSIGDDDEDLDLQWTEQEEESVRTMYDSCLAKHSLTEAPFPSNGPPPSNFTNSVARQIIRAHAGPGRVTRSKTRSALLSSGRKSQDGSGSGSSDVEDSTSEVEMDAPAPKKWRHGLRATRLKILSLVKERQNAHLEATPRQFDPEATPKRRKPMVRQGSMDFLPTMDNTSTIARLGSMLRQPSGDSFGPKVPTTANSSRQFTRIRMQRTNSLSTIAGSPSQPKKESPVKAPKPAPASSHMMMRLGSESNVLPSTSAAPMSRTFSANSGKGFQGFKRSSRHAAVPPPPPTTTSTSLAPSQATASFAPATITPRKKPAPLSFGEQTPLNLGSKRPPSSGLGSAFNSPLLLGAYPTPDSLQKDGKNKRNSWKKAKIESDEDKMAIEGGDEQSEPIFINQAHGFSLPSQPSADEALEFSIKRRSRPSLSSKSSSLSTASTSSSLESHADFPQPPKLILTPSLSPSSSFSSLTHEPATPSPLSATFNLNDLKLEALSNSPEASDEEESEEDKLQKTGLGFGFLDKAYVDAGNEARALRSQFGEFAWAVEQQQQRN